MKYGNFHLRIENLDDLFSTDDNQNHKKDHDLQINHVFARKTQSVIPFKVRIFLLPEIYIFFHDRNQMNPCYRKKTEEILNKIK